MPALLRLFHWLLPLLMLMAALPARALNPDELLPPEKAFAASVAQHGQQLRVHFDIAKGSTCTVTARVLPASRPAYWARRSCPQARPSKTRTLACSRFTTSALP